MTGPTAYKRLSDARARLWPRVEVGGGRRHEGLGANLG
jgi:hypothetical protein